MALRQGVSIVAAEADPVTVVSSTAQEPSGVAPVIGVITALSGVSSTFTPTAGRPFNITISGTFLATVVLQRNFGTPDLWVPVTTAGSPALSRTAATSEVWTEPESGVAYRLIATLFTSGTINYRISQ